MPAASPRQRSRRWIVFFVVLGVLSAIAIIAPLLYNLSIQLRPEQLADARRRWQEKGPPDYDLECLVKREQGGVAAAEQQYLVKVRAGRVVLLIDQGEVVYVDPALAAVAGVAMLGLSSENPRDYGVPALFGEIETAMRQRTTGERRDYLKADFDPSDGHPTHYIYRVPRTKDRVEWFVKFTRVNAK